MLEERSRFKKRFEANLSMGRVTFQNRSLLATFTLGSGSLLLSEHGQDHSRAGLPTLAERWIFDRSLYFAGILL